jgi:hypothetical protein
VSEAGTVDENGARSPSHEDPPAEAGGQVDEVRFRGLARRYFIASNWSSALRMMSFMS